VSADGIQDNDAEPPFCESQDATPPVHVCSEVNSEGGGNRVCLPHGITTHKRAVLPSLPQYDNAEHATEPIGLLPHL
jgi:hypothetical protein